MEAVWVCPCVAAGVRLLLAAFLVIALTGTAAHAQSSGGAGQIIGRVFDARTGESIAFARVSIEGTSFGTISRSDGRFTLPNVPVGTYRIQASYMGYQPLSLEVAVQDGRTTETEIRLYDAQTQVPPAPTRPERPSINPATGGTIRAIGAEDIEELIIDPALESVVEQQSGVIRDRHRLHLRGGRANEMLYLIEGIPMRDLISGESRGGEAVSARSLAEVSVLSGGFEARYGQAAAGIVEAKIKDGSEQVHGSVGYTTDALTDDRDLDQVDLQIGGPLPLLSGALRGISGDDSGPVRFFLDLAADLENGHLPSIADIPGGSLTAARPDRFLGSTFDSQSFFYPRAQNDWRLLFKSTWQASATNEFSLLWLKIRSVHQGFDEIDIAETDHNANPYPWEWSRRLDHYYTVTEDQSALSFRWDHTWKPSLSQQVKLTRSFQSRHQDVGGNRWDEYDLVTDRSLPPELDTPFFRDAGEPTAFRDRSTATWALDWDWTHLYRQHDVRWGLNTQYEDVQYLAWDAAESRTFRGKALDSFHVYPNTGALYLQDRFEIEGLVAQVGLRYDYWFPGRQVERLMDAAGAPVRFKGYLAPRIQLSHPLGSFSDVYFNYGHFSQRPPYFYVYSNANDGVVDEASRIGNPDLDPTVSVQYELGMNHRFAHDKTVALAVYNKDTYEYPTLVAVTPRDRGASSFFTYRNLDYARTQGIELWLGKQRMDRASWAVSYVYSRAKGKGSGPNDLLVSGSGGDARGTPLEEGYLWWNRPHELKTWFSYQIPRGDRPRVFGISLPSDLELSGHFMVRSGLAYTPQDAVGNVLGLPYSENGPFDSSFDASLVKGFQLGSQRFEIALQAFNLLDHRNAIDLDPATGERWKPGVGSLGVDPLDDPASLQFGDLELAEAAGVELAIDPADPRLGGLPPGSPEYQTVYAELEAEAAALIAPSLRRQVMATIHRYSDPSMIAAPRHIRISIGMEW